MALSVDRYPTHRSARLQSKQFQLTASLVVASVYLCVVIAQIWNLSYNWPHADDFESVQWFRQSHITNLDSLTALLSTHLSIHPIGVQALITVTIFRLIGINIKALIIFNAVIVAATALIAGLNAQSAMKHNLLRIIAPTLSLVAFFHPLQTNHLTWAFEMGWFLVNLIVIINISLLERAGQKAFPAVIFLLFVGSFCSAQGIVGWLCALSHMLLLKWHRSDKLACSTIALGLVMNLIAIHHLAADNSSLLLNDNIIGYASYFTSMIGSLFSNTHHECSLYFGIITLIIITITFNISIRHGFAEPWHRIFSVCVLSSIAMSTLFMIGRYQYGLNWALDLFHFAPMLAPMIFAFAFLSILLLDQWPSYKRFFLGLIGLVCFLGSVASAFAFMRERGTERRTKAAFAMHVMCNEGYSPYVIASANLSLEWSTTLQELKRTLLPLCSSHEPQRARLLEAIPKQFSDLGQANPAARDALKSLWDVYTVHFDLQRAFPPDRPDLLLEFAYNNARTGSGYEPGVLKPFASIYLNLGRH